MSFFHYKRKSLKPLVFASFLLCLVDQVSGQSGRRTKPPGASPNVPPAVADTSDSLPRSVTNTLQHKVKLVIGRDPTSRHLQSEDTIFASFVNRLNQDPNISSSNIGDIKTDDAVKRAKTETEAYVVLLSFSIDSFQSGTILLNSPDLQVDYLVIAPRTGKKLTKGKIYFQSIGGGRLRKSGWPGGIPIKITADGAGVEAAEHVHDWLRLQEVRKRRK